MQTGLRLIDHQLDALLGTVPAVQLEGPQAVGKTTTAARRVATTFALEDPGELTLLRADASRVARVARPVLVDEWPQHPPVLDQVARAVAAGAAPGSFLLTGSCRPTPSGTPLESGATHVRMRPLSLTEREVATPTASLAELLSGSRPPLDGESGVTLDHYADEITASGFPGLRVLPTRARRAALDGYLARVVGQDFAALGHVVRRPASLRAWLRAYACATSTPTSQHEILRDAAGPAARPAKTTAIGYRETLDRLWLLDEVPAWVDPGGVLTALGQHPKRQLADPALAARLLGADAGTLLDRAAPEDAPAPRHGTLLGALFEGLVALSVRVYADTCGGRVSHLRTHRGEHRVDLVVTGADGRVLALAVRLGPEPQPADVRDLHWLRDRLGTRLLDAIVLTTGSVASRRDDGIGVLPAALLGP